jgi:hypothetical protein
MEGNVPISLKSAARSILELEDNSSIVFTTTTFFPNLTCPEILLSSVSSVLIEASSSMKVTLSSPPHFCVMYDNNSLFTEASRPSTSRIRYFDWMLGAESAVRRATAESVFRSEERREG